MYAITTRTERISGCRKQRLLVVRRRRAQTLLAGSYQCRDSAACIIVMTWRPEFRIGPFSPGLRKSDGWSAPSDLSRGVQSRFQSLFVKCPQLETSGRTDADAKTTTILAPRWYFGEAHRAPASWARRSFKTSSYGWCFGEVQCVDRAMMPIALPGRSS
jgi:hypothetical protein